MFSGSMVALVTPMTENEQIDYQALLRLLDYQISAGTDAIVILGSTGEAATITLDEKIEITKIVVQYVKGRLPIIAGASDVGTDNTISLAKTLVDLGIDGCLIASPCYVKPTQEGLKLHFKKIAQHVDIPIILYNHPGRTAVDMLPEVIAELSHEPNIIAVKEASGVVSRVKEISAMTPDDFQIYSGDDPLNLEMIKNGATGAISVVANVAPKLVKEMITYALSNQFAKAKELNDRLCLLNEQLFVESNPIPVKWALNKLKLIEKGIRLPLLPLSSKYEAAVANALDEGGITGID